MKNIVIVLIFAFFASISSFAQTTHTINGKSYNLTEEITGKATLFYTTVNGEYKYFIQKNEELTELTNTKGKNGKYQEEFKEILSILTTEAALDISDIKFTLGSLKIYIDDYNKAVDVNYRMQANRPAPKARLGAFAGLSNNPFVKNPDNEITSTFGLDFEVFDQKASRHVLGFGFKQSLKTNNFKYGSSQITVGYKFRIINKEAFALYPQVNFATYTFTNTEFTTLDETTGTTRTQKLSSSSFDAPVIFSIGADIKLGMGYITISANELFALINLDNQGNFPMDLRLGYKINL